MANELILIVEDNEKNRKLVRDLLQFKGYRTLEAVSGEDGVTLAMQHKPDLILMDYHLPGINGIEAFRRIRNASATAHIPIVAVTASAMPEEEKKMKEAGFDGFLTKPINVKEFVQAVADVFSAKAANWNRTLEQRVADGVCQIEQMGRLKRFLSPQIVDLIVSGATDDPLKSHRREITVVFLDLRGFTAFTETGDPEEVMGVLHEYHAEMGRLIMAYNGTIEHFAGDGIMIFFNDPVAIENPAKEAVGMAIRMQADFSGLSKGWKKRGYDLHMGIGIAQGYATLGTIGFEGRRDYSAIGSVCNLASRLCSEAKAGQILVSQKVFGFVEELVVTEPVGELSLKGFHKPVPAFNVTGLK